MTAPFSWVWVLLEPWLWSWQWIDSEQGLSANRPVCSAVRPEEEVDEDDADDDADADDDDEEEEEENVAVGGVVLFLSVGTYDAADKLLAFSRDADALASWAKGGLALELPAISPGVDAREDSESWGEGA